MSYSYPNSTNADAYRPVRRDYHTDSSNDHSRLVDTLPPWLRQWVAELHAHWIAPSFSITENSRGSYALTARLWRIFRHIFTITNALAVLWFFTLWWGERAVFQDSLERCAWENWERWVCIPITNRSSADSLLLTRYWNS
ncbi:hypothetical protein BDV35DRAFT_160746 [Aspergillus flavus]|uniref:Uncharacterized protein n=1 Tax=Aspergillus flavus TaxID=5059 RepID=A0A5N6H653_ASPFL|nr:hypothetical protein BDV35DRAFT_160746 [Aspergillus flavus]